MARTSWKPTAIRRRHKVGIPWLTSWFHFFVNTSRAHMFEIPRVTSWGWSALGGRYQRNITRGTERIDTPGPGGIHRRYR